MVTLNLRRDAGFLFHGIDSQLDRQALARDVRHWFNDANLSAEIHNIGEFRETIAKSLLGCAEDTKWKMSAIFNRRVGDFFHDVKDVVGIRDDVFYDITDEVQRSPLYDGADLFVNYKTSWSGFSSQFNHSEDGAILNPESQAVTYELTGFWRATGLPHDVVRVLQQTGVSKKQVADELNYLDFLEPGQVEVALQYRYVPMVDGLRDADKKNIIRMAVEEAFVLRRKCDFAIYTQAPDLKNLCQDWMIKKAGHENLVPSFSDGLRKKYELHRAYAENLTENLPDVSVSAILSMVMIESNGERKKTNGVFKGLMQISPGVLKEHVTETLPENERMDPYNYRANMSAGAGYLQWCLDNYNSEKSLVVAVGNYNWGCGNMRDYREGKNDLSPETLAYMAKLLVFSRLFSELGVR